MIFHDPTHLFIRFVEKISHRREPQSRCVFVWSNPNQPIRDILDSSGMAMVRPRLQRLAADDLAKQLWFIRASFATMRSASGRRRQVTHQSVVQDTVIDRERVKAQARYGEASRAAGGCTVGDRLETLAGRGEDDVTWIGLNYRNEGNAAVKPLDRAFETERGQLDRPD